jgi:hypothetical protein
MVQQ